MGQSNIIGGVMLLGFFVYITTKGQLGAYLACFIPALRTENSGAAGSQASTSPSIASTLINTSVSAVNQITATPTSVENPTESYEYGAGN